MTDEDPPWLDENWLPAEQPLPKGTDMDISKHHILKQCYALGLQIEMCGAGDELTKATTMAAELSHAVEKLVDQLHDAIFVLRMVDDNNRVDAGEKLKAWDGDFVVTEIRRLL